MIRSLAALCLATSLILPLAAKPGETFPPLKPAELAAIEAALPDKPIVKPAQPRRVLVFYRTEGFVHQSIGQGRAMLEALGKKSGAYTAESSDDMAMFDAANLAKFDAVIFFNSTGLKFENPAHRESLLNFVNSGKGIVGIHAATDNFPNWPEGQELMGGVFHGHPWRANDTVAVKLDLPKHILNRPFGGQGFWVRDEIYQIMGPYSRDKQTVLNSLDMSKPENKRDKGIDRTDNDFPISWFKSVGKGRVFYSSLGHNADVYWQPEVARFFLSGIQYAAGDLSPAKFPGANATTGEPALAPAKALALQDRVDTRAAVAAVARLQDADAKVPARALEAAARAASVEERAALETAVLAALSDANTTVTGKDLLLRWLAGFGSTKCLRALDAYKADPRLGTLARQANLSITGQTPFTMPTVPSAADRLGNLRSTNVLDRDGAIRWLTRQASPADFTRGTATFASWSPDAQGLLLRSIAIDDRADGAALALTALKSPTPDVQAAAATALGAVGKATDAAALLALLDAPAPVGAAVGDALARLAGTETTTTLASAMTQATGAKKAQFIRILGTRAEPAALTALLAATPDKDKDVQKALTDALPRVVRGTDLPRLIEAAATNTVPEANRLLERAALASARMVKDPSAAVPTVVKSAQTAQGAVRTLLVSVLGALDAPSAREALVTFLGDADADTRKAAIRVLGQAEGTASVAGLLAAAQKLGDDSTGTLALRAALDTLSREKKRDDAWKALVETARPLAKLPEDQTAVNSLVPAPAPAPAPAPQPSQP